LLAQVKRGVDELGTVKVDNSRLEEIKSGLGAVLGAAAGIKQTTLIEVVDLGLVRENMQGSKVALEQDKIIVLDTNNSRIVEVDPVAKTGKVVVGTEALGEAKYIGPYPKKFEVWSSKGVVECVTENFQCSVKNRKGLSLDKYY
jgi:hypothetical protein